MSRTPWASGLLASLLLPALTAPQSVAAPITELSVESTHSPFSALWTSSDSSVTTLAGRRPPDGLVDVAIFQFVRVPAFDYGSVTFSTEAIPDQPLEPGLYTGVQRYPFEEPGHPAFTAAIDGWQGNMAAGEFTVLDARFDYSTPNPSVVSFAATFHIFEDGDLVDGHVYFNYDPSPAPEPAGAVLFAVGSLGLLAYGWMRRKPSGRVGRTEDGKCGRG
jgi:hypothetical protein